MTEFHGKRQLSKDLQELVHAIKNLSDLVDRMVSREMEAKRYDDEEDNS